MHNANWLDKQVNIRQCHKIASRFVDGFQNNKMALVLKKTVDSYYYAMDHLADPRVNDWLNMSTPWPSLIITALYLYFVLDLGPKIMKNRPAYNLEKVMIAYNAVQILACLYIVTNGWRYIFLDYNWKCQPVDYNVNKKAILVAHLQWFYSILKITDLLDTVFFVLRKKNNQITFLHVYHHSFMVLMTWVTTKFIAGGTSFYITWTNSFIHVMMYAYYLAAAVSKNNKNIVKLKPYLTNMQLIQFILLIFPYSFPILNISCKFPKWYCIFLGPQNLFMQFMFRDFYKTAYNKKASVQ